MRFGERILLFFLRPIYRVTFKGPIERAKAELLADVDARFQRMEQLSAQLRDAEANLAAMLHNLRAEIIPYLQRVEARKPEPAAQVAENVAAQLRSLEASNMAQWNAIEQLLIALFRLPEPEAFEIDSKAGPSEQAAISRAAGLIGVHAASNIR